VGTAVQEQEPVAVVEATEAPIEEEAPAATDIPRPTATLEPVMAAEVLSANWYEDSIGTLWFVGELQNTGEVDLGGVEIIVSLKVEDGSLVGVASSYATVSVVGVDEKAPFSVMFSEPGEWTDYEINVEAGKAGSFDYAISYRDLEIIDSSGIPGDFPVYKVVGQVENVGDGDAEFVEITATLYDAEGAVVGVDSTYAEFDVLKVGQVSPFEIQVLNVAGEVDRYSLVAEGSPISQ
jgi:hypothetical protein